MAGEFTGLNYACGDGAVRIFNVQGKALDENRWTVQGHEQRPSIAAVLLATQNCFARIEAMGRGAEIARLVVEPIYGVVYYLGGLLTAQHLSGANEEQGVITVPAFEVCERQVMLVILATPKYSMVAADAHGGLIY